MNYLYGVLVAAILLGCGPNGLDPTNGQGRQGHGSDGPSGLGSTGEQDKLQQGAEQYAFLAGTWSSPWGEEWSFDISSKTVTVYSDNGQNQKKIERFTIAQLTQDRLQIYETFTQRTPSVYSTSKELISDAPKAGSYYFVVNAEGALVDLDIARYIVDADTSKDITKFSEYIIRDKDYFPKYLQVMPYPGEFDNGLEQFVMKNAIKKNTDIANVDGTTYVKSVYAAGLDAKGVNKYRLVDEHEDVYRFFIYDEAGNYKWKLENNAFIGHESTATPEVQELIDAGWEVQKPTSMYDLIIYTMQYDKLEQSLTVKATSSTPIPLTRKEG